MELWTFFVEVDDQAEGHTLISRRHADGITFTVDEATGRIQTDNGLCVHTGAGSLHVSHLCYPISSYLIPSELK